MRTNLECFSVNLKHSKGSAFLSLEALTLPSLRAGPLPLPQAGEGLLYVLGLTSLQALPARASRLQAARA